MASKLDLAAIVTAACWMLSIEYGNHIFTDVPTRTERSALAAAADCPDNDNMPYPASCLIFLEGKLASEVWRRRAAERGAVAQPAAVKQDESISPGVECPDKARPLQCELHRVLDRPVLATQYFGECHRCGSTIAMSQHSVFLGSPGIN